jgi:hypothetical protein
MGADLHRQGGARAMYLGGVVGVLLIVLLVILIIRVT